MAWQDEMVPLLRVLISDVSTTPEFNDLRLTDVIVACAYIVNQEVAQSNDYTIIMSSKTISPDPVDEEDDIFISLVLLKSACLCAISTAKTKAYLEGIKANLGPVSLQVGGSFAAFSSIMDNACQAYQDLKNQIAFGGQGVVLSVRAVLSPFVGNKFDGRDLAPYNGHQKNLYS